MLTRLTFTLFIFNSQASVFSNAVKTLITVSTFMLLGLIVAYHALEVQVSCISILRYFKLFLVRLVILVYG